MALVKCPRCELNYMQDTDKFCTICRREMHGEDVKDEMAGICSECGEHSSLPGEELCYYCYREIKRQEGITEAAGSVPVAPDEVLDVTAASAMDEIVIELEDDDDLPDDELKAMGKELTLDEGEEEEALLGDEDESVIDQDALSEDYGDDDIDDDDGDDDGE